MRHFLPSIPLVLSVLMVSGCVTGQVDSVTAVAGSKLLVKGSATYRERITFPAGAILIVRVEDVSVADASSILLAETRVEPKGRQVPLAFELQVPRSAIDSKVRISVSARVEGKSGDLLWITDSFSPLPEANGTSSVNVGELVMVRTPR